MNYESNIKGNLARRYKIKHFLAFTEQAKEAVWQGLSVIFFTLVISYFMSHWVLWLVGFYN